MPPPTFSVVVTWQQPEPWLAVLLASLLRAGDGLHWELLAVVESSGNSEAEALLQAFATQLPPGRLQLLQADGGGRAAARNLALAHCRADLITFLTGEQRCSPQRLALPQQLLNLHPDLDLLCCGWRVGERVQQPWLEGSGFDAATLLRHRGLRTGCLTVRRAVLERLGGFNAGLPAWSGIDLVLRLAADGGQAAWIDQALMRYRPQHQRNRDITGLQQGLDQLIEIHGEGIPPAELVELRFAALAWCAGLAWQQQQPQLASQLLRQAALSAPLPVPRARVQLLEQLSRSQRWCGQCGEAAELLQSDPWRQSVALWP
ncbi:MAG: glycosyltransferase [Cyanobacteriota bacterium]